VSVLPRTRRSATTTFPTHAGTVPAQRVGGRPLPATAPAVAQPHRRRRTAALVTAAVLVGSAAGTTLVLTRDDSPAVVAPAGTPGGPTTTDLQRDRSQSERGQDAERASDALRDEVLSRRAAEHLG